LTILLHGFICNNDGKNKQDEEKSLTCFLKTTSPKIQLISQLKQFNNSPSVATAKLGNVNLFLDPKI